MIFFKKQMLLIKINTQNSIYSKYCCGVNDQLKKNYVASKRDFFDIYKKQAEKQYGSVNYVKTKLNTSAAIWILVHWVMIM